MTPEKQRIWSDRMVSPQFINVLRKIHNRLKDCDVNWAVVGSLGLALRGIPIEPHDIDIMTDRLGAYEIGRIFLESVTKRVAPRTSETIQSHFGALEIDGVKVEIMGDFRVRLRDGIWEKPLEMTQYKQMAHVEEMLVPVLSLECEYQLSLKLGRTDKAEMLKKLLPDMKLH